MIFWGIKGETGKSLDLSFRLLETMDVKSAVVTFRSLGTDTLVYTQEIDASTSSSQIAEDGQVITLQRDGVKFFSGIVTNQTEETTAASHTITTTVSGPWWFAENIPLTGLKNDPAGTGNRERQVYQFADQNLKTSIEAIISRAAVIGVPWSLGTVSNFFTFPQITLNQMTCAQALSELVRMCPDAMTWFDYSGSTPVLNVTRRADATVREFVIGSQDVTGYRINPVRQLQVSQVRVQYADRATNGKRRHQEQNAGSFAAGKVQVLTVSGPELAAFLPPDPPTESAVIRTIPTTSLASAFTAFANTEIDDIVRLRSQYGPTWQGPSPVGVYQTTAGIMGDGTINLYSTSSGGTALAFKTFKPTFLDSNKNPVSGHFVYPSVIIPDWLALGGVRVKYSFMYLVNLRWKSSTNPNGQPQNPGLVDFAGGASTQQNAFTHDSSYDRISIFWKVYEGEGLVLPSAYNGVTFYRPPEYTFVAPPPTFAGNMLAAQSWLPYEGDVRLVSEDIGAFRYRGCRVNVVNSRLTAHASMGALVESESLDLMSEGLTVSLGAPPRIDYRTLLEKVRRTPQDNIPQP